MLRLTRHQRLMMAEKLLDMANLAAGALVFGQFVGDRPFSTVAATLGFALWISFVGCGIVLSREMP